MESVSHDTVQQSADACNATCTSPGTAASASQNLNESILLGSCSDKDLKDFLSELSKSVLPPEQFVFDLIDASAKRNLLLSNVAPVRRGQNENSSGYSRRVVVVGDLHGQFRDLRTILTQDRVDRMPSSTNTYIFNGDLVDRGDMSVEILIALLAIQNTHKDSVLILRGNHETSSMNSEYGFEKEVLKKYNSLVLERFRQWFRTFPFAAVIEDSVFVCHGGLGPRSHKMTIAEINKMYRICEPVPGTPMHELMWCDPSEDAGIKVGAVRGYGFGQDITESFLALNKLSFMIRSHEWRESGFSWMHDRKCCTVFSAANYCGNSENPGAVVVFDAEKSMESRVAVFSAAHYSLYLPVWARLNANAQVPPADPAAVASLEDAPASPPHSPCSVAQATAPLTPATAAAARCEIAATGGAGLMEAKMRKKAARGVVTWLAGCKRRNGSAPSRVEAARRTPFKWRLVGERWVKAAAERSFAQNLQETSGPDMDVDTLESEVEPSANSQSQINAGVGASLVTCL